MSEIFTWGTAKENDALIGTKVKLSDAGRLYWGEDEDHGVGVVEHFSEDIDTSAAVRWPNGRKYSYRRGDLVIVSRHRSVQQTLFWEEEDE